MTRVPIVGAGLKETWMWAQIASDILELSTRVLDVDGRGGCSQSQARTSGAGAGDLHSCACVHL